MIKTVIIIIVAFLLLMLFWKLMKNFIKALVIVVLLVLFFAGVMFVRDYNIMKSVTSSDRLVVLEDDSVPLIGIKNNQITNDYKTPYIEMDINKIDFEYSGIELLGMLQSEEDDEIKEAIDVINDELSKNFMSNLDKKIIKIKPEPYFMAMLKGNFRDKLKEDISLVGSAIKSNVTKIKNESLN
jgi:energy-coupling factor transporter transmembrane protein EcfT